MDHDTELPPSRKVPERDEVFRRAGSASRSGPGGGEQRTPSLLLLLLVLLLLLPLQLFFILKVFSGTFPAADGAAFLTCDVSSLTLRVEELGGASWGESDQNTPVSASDCSLFHSLTVCVRQCCSAVVPSQSAGQFVTGDLFTFRGCVFKQQLLNYRWTLFLYVQPAGGSAGGSNMSLQTRTRTRTERICCCY